MTSAGTTSSQNFTLASGGSIRGRLTNSNGSGVQFAFVNAFSETAHSFGFTMTLSDGSFDVSGLTAASDFRLFIQPPSSTGGVTPTFVEGITVTQGTSTDVGTITATSADSSISVNLTNSGSAIESAKVHAWKPFTPYFGQCTTNSTGQCTMLGLASGTYDVFVDSAGRPPTFQSLTVDGSTIFAFDFASSLGSLYVLNGTVTNSSGSAIANAEVGIWNETTRRGMHSRTDSNGLFRMDGVPQGEYNFGSRHPDFFDYKSTVSISANATRNITLTLLSSVTTYTMNGWIVSASNESVASKTVMVVDVANASMFSVFNLTNASGYYSIANVPAATYAFTAVMGNQTFSVNSTITSDKTVNISVS